MNVYMLLHFLIIWNHQPTTTALSGDLVKSISTWRRFLTGLDILLCYNFDSNGMERHWSHWSFWWWLITDITSHFVHPVYSWCAHWKDHKLVFVTSNQWLWLAMRGNGSIVCWCVWSGTVVIGYDIAIITGGWVN